jgi:hypothetical protein
MDGRNFRSFLKTLALSLSLGLPRAIKKILPYFLLSKLGSILILVRSGNLELLEVGGMS